MEGYAPIRGETDDTGESRRAWEPRKGLGVVRAIRQKHIGKGAPVLVEAVGLERDFFSEDEIRRGAQADTNTRSNAA